MARINLLPWREEYRREKKQEFLTQLAGVCILAALICYGWMQSVDNAIASQRERNAILDNEIKLLSKKVEEIQRLKKERRELLDRMRVIQDLEGKRSIIVHYFDEFAKAVPDGVYITSLKRSGNVFSIVGVSESNNRISSFMRQLDASDWFSDPNLKSVKALSGSDDEEGQATFAMDLKAVLPDSGENKDG
ncbi:hypothetical protein TDB9533_00339 [Thalassocella blandensis]|nr:hypothetical protein TDB9533_00339 [Thalassocella blandensis]